ncbi:hypothetical protein ACFOWM_13935, partial [Ferruginibacter yonginensis]
PSVLQYPGLRAVLKDNFTGVDKTLSLTSVTDVSFDVTSNPQSYASNRFMIVFKNVPPTQITSITAERQSNQSVEVEWHTANENNMDRYEVQRSTDGTTFNTISAQIASANNMGTPYYIINDGGASVGDNWYRVIGHQIVGGNINSATVKVAAVVTATKQGVSIYPNPVVGDNINVHFNGQPLG